MLNRNNKFDLDETNTYLKYDWLISMVYQPV